MAKQKRRYRRRKSKSTARPADQEKKLIAPKRRVPLAFKILLPVFGVLLLVVAELVLRLVGYGSGYRLFERDRRDDGTEIYRLNPNAAERFFFRRVEGKAVAPSRVLPVEFPVKKPADTIRIVALGGSTTAGFPYPRSGAFPGFLKAQLSDLHQDKKFEVINCGLTALNSYSVLDFVPEVLRCNPDLIVVYSGHNEFYGALGVGSSQSVASSRAITRLFMKIQKIRLYQAFRGLIESLRKPPEGKSQTTLIRAMAKDQEIWVDSRKFAAAEAAFRANLEAVLRKARRRHVPVVLCTLISNVRDLSPMISAHAKDWAKARNLQWDSTLRAAITLEKDGDTTGAIAQYRSLLDLDDQYAEAHFRLARVLAALGKWDEARGEYEQALRYDALRFRAPPGFNRILREVASESKSGDLKAPVILADVEPFVSEKAAGGVIGYDLMTDHLHPNTTGTCLIAQSICEALSSSTIASRFGETWDFSRLRDVGEYEPLVGVSAIEKYFASSIILSLYSGFPFDTQIDHDQVIQTLELNYFHAWKALSPEEAEVALESPSSRRTFDVHMALAERHFTNQDYSRAAEAYRAAIRQRGQGAPEQYQRAWVGIAESERKLGHFSEAVAAYTEALKIKGNAKPIWYNIGRIYMAMLKYDEAEKAFQQVLALEPNDDDALINMGVICRDRTEFDKAREYFEKAAAIESGRVVATYHLATLDMNQNNLESAIQRLEQALKWQPDHVQSLRMLGFVHLQQKDYEPALAALEKACMINPGDAATWYNAAVASAHLEKGDDAARQLWRAIQLDRKKYLTRASQEEAFGKIVTNQNFVNVLRGRAPRDAASMIPVTDEGTTQPAVPIP